MSDKISKFTEAPLVAYGTAAGPWIERRRTPTVPWAMLVYADGPSKSIRPVMRLERHVPDVRIRMWCASASGSIWISSGYYTVRLHRYVLLRARSWWRRKFPRTPADWPTATVKR